MTGKGEKEVLFIVSRSFLALSYSNHTELPFCCTVQNVEIFFFLETFKIHPKCLGHLGCQSCLARVATHACLT